MIILGIESSCDDTSVALTEATPHPDRFHVISEMTASQIDIHKKYGGVVPEFAGRAHAEAIVPLVEEVMMGHAKPDAIAVTAGPGLMTGLLVGVEAAKTLSYLWDVPLVAVNHIEGHIHSVELPPRSPNHLTTLPPNHLAIETHIHPIIKTSGQVVRWSGGQVMLGLVVSGGHTELITMRGPCDFERIGWTRDDAAGECFDKVGKLLDFDYPGGPKISKVALAGDPFAIAFPRPMIHDESFDFSFAGLKTAALYWLRDHEHNEIENFCASFEQAIVDVLVEKTIRAAKKFHPKTIILGGGVSANRKLREALANAIKRDLPDANFLLPAPAYCADNGAMIAVAGYYRARNGDSVSWRDISVDPNWKIGTPSCPLDS